MPKMQKEDWKDFNKLPYFSWKLIVKLGWRVSKGRAEKLVFSMSLFVWILFCVEHLSDKDLD